MYDDEDRELYEFTWPGKNAAKLEAGRSTRKTLRPCIEDSRNFDTTENLYIEGDNLEALKILQRSYLRKVKMIYIDPPYNTGNDFIYHDDFREEQSQHEEHYGLYDEDGNRNFSKQNYVVNTRSNPRFHSEWCNMIYPRLKLARNLLSLDGVIFISIDDSEQPALRMICDEIFGANNFVAQLVWDLGTGTTAGLFTRGHEYILVYAKSRLNLKNFKNYEEGGKIIHGALKKISSKNPAVEITFPAGFEFEGKDAVFTGEVGDAEKEYILSNEMRFKDGKLVAPTTLKAGFAMRNQVLSYIAGQEVYDTKGQKVKRFFFNSKGILFYEKEKSIINPRTVLSGLANTKNGTTEIATLLGGNYFAFPKPSTLIKYLAQLVTNKTSLILDFFSGSSTTAHAVMNLNAHDGGTRKFIMIQLPEPCKPDSEAFKAGYRNICEIGRERIRRAGDKLTEGDDLQLSRENLPDIGFRTFRVDSANMRENVYLTVDEMLSEGMSFESLTDNIKPDRSDMDLLFECVRDLKLPLSLKYSCEEFQGVTIHHYNKPELAACFGKNLTPEVMRYIAESGAKYVYFRDWCFEDIKAKVNLTQIFELYGEESKMRIL